MSLFELNPEELCIATHPHHASFYEPCEWTDNGEVTCFFSECVFLTDVPRDHQEKFLELYSKDTRTDYLHCFDSKMKNLWEMVLKDVWEE